MKKIFILLALAIVLSLSDQAQASVLYSDPLTAPPLNAGNLVGEARTIIGEKLAGIETKQEMLDFCAEHGIVADVEVIDIADINEAWQRVKDSDVRYRFVIDVAGSLRG